MPRFKIGQLSRMLDIPVETIRFLEQKGLLVSEKDEKNGYRYFEVWDADLIFKYQRFRQLGCSMREAIRLVRESDINDTVAFLAEKEEQLRRQTLVSDLQRRRLEEARLLIVDAERLVGKFAILPIPEMYAVFMRRYDESSDSLRSAQETPDFERLSQYHSFLDYLVRIRREAVADPEHQKGEWGVALSKKWADPLGFVPSEETVCIKRRLALYTVLKLQERSYFTVESIAPVLRFMEENRMTLDGDVIAIDLITPMTGESPVRYLQLWAPFRSEYGTEEFDAVGRLFYT